MQPWYKHAALSPEFVLIVLGFTFFVGIALGLGARRFPVLTSTFLGALASSVWWVFLHGEAKAIISAILVWSVVCAVPSYLGAYVGQRMKRRSEWA